MKNIRTILFDFGNVLIDIDIPHAKAKLESLMRLDLPAKAVERHLVQLIHQYETSAIDTDGFINGILKFAQPEVRSEDVVEAWNSMLIGMPRYRLAMLEAIKDNVTLMLLSNTNALHIEWVHNHMVNMHGIADFERRYFHGVFYSHLIRLRKPQPEAFQFVMNNAYVTPSSTLFIDDVPENIRTAKRLGFKTWLFEPEDEIAVVMREAGYY